MVRITKKVDYSILILAHLAQNPGRSSSTREIADRFHIPRPVVANLLKTLCKSRLVSSQRGNRGGYRLARQPRQITLANLLGTVEGDFAFAKCTGGGAEGRASNCPLSGQCPSEPTVRYVHQEIHRILSSVTVEHLAGEFTSKSPISPCTPAGSTNCDPVLVPVGPAD